MKTKLILAATLLFLASCSSRKEPSVAAPAADTSATRTEYTCPMHPEVTSSKAGTCPQCGMDLQIKS